MKILYHHRTRGRGAEGVHIRGVVKGLRQLGHHVQILSLPGAAPEDEEKMSAPIPKKPKKASFGARLLGFVNELTKYMPEIAFEMCELLFNVIAWRRLRKIVYKEKVDFIYERYSLFMFISVWWARRHCVPIILEVNDSCQVDRVRPLCFKSLACRVEKMVFRNADGLVFISTRFKKIIELAYGDIAPSVVSPNAVDLDIFVPDGGSGQRVRKKLDLHNKVVVGYVGAFVYWHGIDWFVELIIDRLKEYPELHLLLVGDGVCFNTIKSRVAAGKVESQVTMPGRVSHDEIPNYIEAMDFGVLPDSNDYGSSMKLFEFMAMGKGMVAPDFPPIAEVVKDRENSWLFPANDRNACVDMVLSLVGDKAQQHLVGVNARSYIERERQWRHNAEQIITLLQ